MHKKITHFLSRIFCNTQRIDTVWVTKSARLKCFFNDDIQGFLKNVWISQIFHLPGASSVPCWPGLVGAPIITLGLTMP